MSLMRIEHISTGYGKKQVLFDVSLDIEQGKTLLIVGANGSGKSTLYKAIYRTLDLWQGKIYYQNEDLNKYKTHQLIEKGIMYIPQKNELFEDLTVLENLELSLLHHNKMIEIKQKITEIIEVIPLLKKKLKSIVNTLSGGERKFVSLGMVLLNNPKILFLDEILAGLSNENIDKVIDTLNKIKRNGITLVVIEHRIKELFPIADRTVGFKLGKLYTDNLNSLDNIKSFMI